MSVNLPWDGSVVSLSESFERLEDGAYSVNNLGERFRVEKFKNSIPLIVDEIKPIFGLPKIGRHRLEYLDFTSVLLCREIGVETEISKSEDYDVFKTRVFRWIVGLPTMFVNKDMIVRSSFGVVEVISSRDESIDFDRPDPPFVKGSSLWNVEATLSTMLYGYSLSSLREALSEVVVRIDSSMVWISNGIVSRLSSYGFMKEDDIM